MLKKTVNFICILITTIILSGCFGDEDRIVEGKVMRVSSSDKTGYAWVDVRIDCKNPTCGVRRFYFNNENKSNYDTYNYTAYYSMITNQAVTVHYDDYLFIDVLKSIS
jgi:hypothetical protein